MAGEWIKFELSTLDKPEVVMMADILGTSTFDVVGRLLQVWGWFDKQTVDGNAGCVTGESLLRFIDHLVASQGFGASMKKVGWLTDTGLPNFDRHNGKTAKNRALTNRRVAKMRNGDGVTKSLPEKRREEKINTSVPTERAEKPPADPIEIIFQIGTPLLTQSGISNANARSLLGKLRKDHGDVPVSQAVLRMARDRPSEPAAWIVAALVKPADRGKQAAKTAAEWVGQLIPRRPDEITIDGTSQRLD